MLPRCTLAGLVAISLASASLYAQSAVVHVPAPVPQMREFDYLLGEWSYVAKTQTPGVPPVFQGTWRAWRLDDGRGIMDEYRAVDDSGHIAYYGLTVRTWDAGAGHWNIWYIDRSLNGQWGSTQTGEARFESGEMHLLQRGAGSMLRIRYYNVQPDRFSWSADRSTDGGATWTIGAIAIEARRVAKSASGDR